MSLFNLSPAEFCEATNACEDGRDLAFNKPTMADVWDNCPRAEWLLWIAYKIGKRSDDRMLRLFAVWCARNTPLSDGRKTGDLLTDPRSLAALEVAERFAGGMATPQELRAAWNAAWAAKPDNAWTAAHCAARAAAYADTPDDAWDDAWRAANGAAPYAARAAAWAAAPADDRTGAAQRAATWDAAQAAAWAAQATHLRTLVPNPFRKETQP